MFLFVVNLGITYWVYRNKDDNSQNVTAICFFIFVGFIYCYRSRGGHHSETAIKRNNYQHGTT